MTAYEQHLLTAEDQLQQASHRHRTLTASIEMSVECLPEEHRRLLSGLWLFHAAFLPETAVAIFDPEYEGDEDSPSVAQMRLADLFDRSLLAMEVLGFRKGRYRLYRLLPTLRPYVRQMPQSIDEDILYTRFGVEMAEQVNTIYSRLDEGGVFVYLAQQGEEDFRRGLGYVSGEVEARYYLHWGRIQHRLGDWDTGLSLTEKALELSEEKHPRLSRIAMNNMAIIYSDIGQHKIALNLFQQVLVIQRQSGDRDGEAITLTDMGCCTTILGSSRKPLPFINRHYRSGVK